MIILSGWVRLAVGGGSGAWLDSGAKDSLCNEWLKCNGKLLGVSFWGVCGLGGGIWVVLSVLFRLRDVIRLLLDVIRCY